MRLESPNQSQLSIDGQSSLWGEFLSAAEALRYALQPNLAKQTTQMTCVFPWFIADKSLVNYGDTLESISKFSEPSFHRKPNELKVISERYSESDKPPVEMLQEFLNSLSSEAVLSEVVSIDASFPISTALISKDVMKQMSELIESRMHELKRYKRATFNFRYNGARGPVMGSIRKKIDGRSITLNKSTHLKLGEIIPLGQIFNLVIMTVLPIHTSSSPEVNLHHPVHNYITIDLHKEESWLARFKW